MLKPQMQKIEVVEESYRPQMEKTEWIVTWEAHYPIGAEGGKAFGNDYETWRNRAYKCLRAEFVGSKAELIHEGRQNYSINAPYGRTPNLRKNTCLVFTFKSDTELPNGYLTAKGILDLGY